MTSYDDVNNAWVPALPLPPITARHAAKFYLKLRRHFGAPYKGRRVIRPRRVWAAPRGTAYAHGNGWPRMVHDASHRVFGVLHPTFLTHSSAHAALEKRMIDYVLERGWTTPAQKPPKPSKDDKRAAALANVEGRIKRWETKGRLYT